MRHAEKLIGRILFLGGKPVVTSLSNINIGKEVPEQVEFDLAAEQAAIDAYNKAITLAGELEDHATRDILIQILNDEDSHLDEIEELKDQIEHMSLPIFLTTQVG
jgi:bacterioferritin